MIVYFADRYMNIHGQASTSLPAGITIIEDIKTEDVETGVSTFEFKLPFDSETRETVEKYTEVGNYILRSYNGENDFFTIIETEVDTKRREVYVYAEDAGLDLLNEIAREYAADKAYSIDHYINKFAYDSGFRIGVNEAKGMTRQLSWDTETTAAERLASIAEQFDGCEISYSFDIKGLGLVTKYINIYKQRGNDVGKTLRLNQDVDRIITTKSIANIATAIRVTGGTPEAEEDSEETPVPITLDGYKYDDGDFWLDGTYLKSRKALQLWTRYNAEDGNYTGYICRTFEGESTTQAELLQEALAELKRLCEIEVNYEVEVKQLPDDVRIGDRVNIVDSEGRLYLSSRILKLTTSAADQNQTVTLGEYLLKSSGISQKVVDLANKFAKTAESAKRALTVAGDAKSIANEAQAQAGSVLADVGAAHEAAEAAVTKADEAKASVDGMSDRVLEVETQSLKNAAESAKKTEVADTLGNYYTKTQAEEVIEDKTGNLSSIIGDKITTSEQGLQEQITAVTKNITIDADGITISGGNSALKLRIDNSRIVFLKGETELGYWDGDDFNTGNIVVKTTERAQFGNFAFVPRSDGSLSFFKIS